MTEKEKMLAGLPYFSGGEELTAGRLRAAELVYEYNHLRPGDPAGRERILKELFGGMGEDVQIEPDFRCDYGGNVFVGSHVSINYDCIFLDCAKITLGSHVFLAPGVGLFTAGHPVHHAPRDDMLEYARPITIGDSVWIGGGAIVCPGVTIGAEAVIGAGSVVTRNVPPKAVAAGNPCRVLRNITEEDRKYYFRRLPFPAEDLKPFGKEEKHNG